MSLQVKFLHNYDRVRYVKVFWDGPDPRAKKREVGLSGLDVAYHQNESGRIIVSVPGRGSSVDGYAGKHFFLGEHIRENNLAGFVRSAHPFFGFEFDITVFLITTMGFLQEYKDVVCKSRRPEIYLMGFSAGASAIAALAYLYPEVSRILLIAPSGDAGMREIRNGLRRFTGQVFIAVGENDEVVGPEAGDAYFRMATGASYKELIKIPDCDHQFRGRANGQVLSQLPFYAFHRGRKPRSFHTCPKTVLYE